MTIDRQELAHFKAFLDEMGYTEDGLLAQLRTARPPSSENYQSVSLQTHEPTSFNALVRFFLLGNTLPKDAVEKLLPEWIYELCSKYNFLETEADKVRAKVVIVPIGPYVFLSDAFHVVGSEHAAEFILPASTHSANFLKHLMLTEPVDTALDLCCGCGIHAVFASGFSKQVVASDISAAAIHYAQINAAINGRDNIAFVTGNVFEALEGQTFDLIISNPPFVIGPGDEFVYRDNPMVLDEFCRELVREAPAFLNEGGHLQMLCEWVEIAGESWQQRLQNWTKESGCDTWVLRTSPIPTTRYTSIRLSDLGGPNVDQQGDFGAWMANFKAHQVNAIHPGMILLRKRSGENWFHIRNLPIDIKQAAGQTISTCIAACDHTQQLRSDGALLRATLQLSTELELEQSYERQHNAWQSQKLRLRRTGVLPLEADVDMPVMALLNLFDGSKPVSACIEQFVSSSKSDPGKMREQFLPILRMFTERGFLELK
ncbi:MAG: hypothetical protein ACI9GW_003261 [Halieaceae bacterium]